MATLNSLSANINFPASLELSRHPHIGHGRGIFAVDRVDYSYFRRDTRYRYDMTIAIVLLVHDKNLRAISQTRRICSENSQRIFSSAAEFCHNRSHLVVRTYLLLL